jgi:hypothetical protein
MKLALPAAIGFHRIQPRPERSPATAKVAVGSTRIGWPNPKPDSSDALVPPAAASAEWRTGMHRNIKSSKDRREFSRSGTGPGPVTLESLFTSLQKITDDDEMIVRVVSNLCANGVLRRPLDLGGRLQRICRC